jgi:hypothetical protein
MGNLLWFGGKLVEARNSYKGVEASIHPVFTSDILIPDGDSLIPYDFVNETSAHNIMSPDMR